MGSPRPPLLHPPVISFSAGVRTISVPTRVELSLSRLDTAGEGQVRVAPKDTHDSVTISTNDTCK